MILCSPAVPAKRSKEPGPVNYHDFVTVYTLTDSIKAGIIQDALEAEGIRCFLEGQTQIGDPLTLKASEIKVQVPAADAERAAEFLREHDKKHGEQVEES